MNAAQRIRLIRIIEKIEKNPEFSNKLGVKNTSDLVCWKIFYIWLKSILGNPEITLYGYFLPSDIDWNGGRRINVYSFSTIDHWWDYRTCNFTFIKSQRGVFYGI